MRTWHKSIPMKYLHDQYGLYQGTWSAQMDRYWESDDGFTVSSRQIKTEWGVVEHVTITRINDADGDISWAVKQSIKDELFGIRATAIEVFPSKKNLVDVMNVYHLWVLPKDFKLPFGIHPVRDVQCQPIERGYDFNIDDCIAWNESPERAAIGHKRVNHLSSPGSDSTESVTSHVPDVSMLSQEQLDAELEKGYNDLKAGNTLNAKEAFSGIRKDLPVISQF